jgi:hypothetical protein
MLRATLALHALLASSLFPAWTPSPDIIPEGARPLEWLGTTIERGDFDGAAGEGWLLVVGSIPSRLEEVTLTEPVTDLPFAPYQYLLFAMPPQVAEEWLAAKAGPGEGPSLGDFAREHGVREIAFGGSRRNERTESPARAFRAGYRATLDGSGRPGVERTLFELLDADGAVLGETDVLLGPPDDGGPGRAWTYGLVLLALVGGGLWLLTRRNESS